MLLDGHTDELPVEKQPFPGIEMQREPRLSYPKDKTFGAQPHSLQRAVPKKDRQTEAEMTDPERATPVSDSNLADPIGCALHVLTTLRLKPEGLRRDELQDRIDTSPEVLDKTLERMMAQDALRYEKATKTYQLSFSVLQSVLDMLRTRNLALVAQPELGQLRDLSGETAVIAVDDGKQSLNMGHALSNHPIRMGDRLGSTYPYHCSSTGKVFAAYFPQDRLRTFLNEPLPARTAHTIQNRAELEHELNETRRRGYAITNEELVEGRRAIAAPIFDGSGTVVGAIALSGPSFRVTPARVPALIEAVKAAARRITERLTRADLTPVNPPRITCLSPTPVREVSSPKWSKERRAFIWLDLEANAIWSANEGEAPKILRKFDTPIKTLVNTSGDQIVALTESKLINLSTGKTSLLDTSIQSAVPGTANDIWAVADRHGEKVLVNITLDGQSSDHAVLPRGIGCMAYCAVTGSIYLGFPEQGVIQSYNLITRHLKQICQFSKATGRPCALAIDAKWNLWVAFADGWGMAKLNLNGQILARYNLPIPQPTGLHFGGPEMKTLMVTSHRAGLGEEVLENAPLSGQAFCIHFND